jgi:hypothetical protein
MVYWLAGQGINEAESFQDIHTTANRNESITPSVSDGVEFIS